MKTNTIRLLILLVMSMFVGKSHAQVIYFQEGFEAGTITAEPMPIWSWQPVQGVALGPMFHEEDIYTVSGDISYSGTYSWRLDFAGRNNWCNQCGSAGVTLSQSDIDSAYVEISGAPWADTLFNKTNGFSRWPINSYTDDGINFDTVSALADSLTMANGFTAGDELKIPYKCGVNGIVAGNINKRSDCNKAINYLDRITAADFDYGKSISRSFYMYIPTETLLPNITFKLGYFRARRTNDGNSQVNYTLKISVQRGMKLELSTPAGNVVSPPTGNSFIVEKDQWYYFEETWTRESAGGLSDGKYILYARKANDSPGLPIVTQENVHIGSLLRMSVNGNFQNTIDASGYVYFDNILITSSLGGGAMDFILADGFE